MSEDQKATFVPCDELYFSSYCTKYVLTTSKLKIKTKGFHLISLPSSSCLLEETAVLEASVIRTS